MGKRQVLIFPQKNENISHLVSKDSSIENNPQNIVPRVDIPKFWGLVFNN